MNSLITFIREHRDAIVHEWMLRAARLPGAGPLTEPTLRDHMPAIVSKLADAIDRRDTSAKPLDSLPEQHAALRFRDGYDLRQIVAEYRLLREVVMDMYTAAGDLSADVRPKMKPLTVMHEAVDRAIAEAVDQYAVERDRVRETFIAILGHDLRDPLNAILFSATTLSTRTGELDDRTLKAAERIAASARRMERMIRELLDFARGRLGGGFMISPARFDARTVIAHAVQETAQAHPGRTVQCPASRAAGDFDVEWDSDRIAQVITNLVGNALVHGSDPVVVTAKDEGDQVLISVANTGEIPPEMLPHLFDAFSTDAPEKERAGLGLGLYIVNQIVQAHGGTVTAASADGSTTIAVRLPRRARRAA